MLHIAFSHSVEQLLKQALLMRSTSFTGDVLSYEPQLQIGDLMNDEERLKMWAEIYQMGESQSEIETLIQSAKKVEERFMHSINKYEKIVFWLGETVTDELAFLRLLTLLRKESKKFMVNRIRKPLLLGDLLPGRIDKIFQPTLLTEGDNDRFYRLWEEICKEGNKLRIRVDDFSFQFYDYSYYDAELLRHVPENEPIKKAVIVGEMTGNVRQLPYYFFVWRVNRLVEEGVIFMEGQELGISGKFLRKVE
ncbi:DUF1835 domain-containing protein [bacterium LRH843]|nr:DUF1835 domain-containing protein [bacterium LRH843]